MKDEDSAIVALAKNAILNNLSTHHQDERIKDLLLLVCIFDPCFKQFTLLDEQEKARAEILLENIAKRAAEDLQEKSSKRLKQEPVQPDGPGLPSKA